VEHQSGLVTTPRMVAIVGAAGAQYALPVILRGLPITFAPPILAVIACHVDFVDRLAKQLVRTSRLPVVVAEDGLVPQSGTFYLAGTERRLTLERGRLKFTPCDPGVRDSMATFLGSMARELGPGAMAVILSGLGERCEMGMKSVRDAGGFTIAQDEATSVVYGMARWAVQSGAICESLPVQEIAPRLTTLAERTV
jgi:two-component system chemotaxis response regulator CheB